MTPAGVWVFCRLDMTGQLKLSAQSFRRVLKTARTVADLAGSKNLSKGIWAPFAHCSAESQHITRRDIRLNVVHRGRYKAPSRVKLVNTKLDFFSNLLWRPVR